MEFETLATGYGLLEGPRTDEQNRLYFSDVRGGGVFRRSPDGRIETLIPERRSSFRERPGQTTPTSEPPLRSAARRAFSSTLAVTGWYGRSR